MTVLTESETPRPVITVDKPELKAARKRLNLTQREMAEKLGTPLRTYQGWEAGRRAPGIVPVCMKLLEKIEGKNVK